MIKDFLKRYFEPQFIRFVLVAMLNTAFGLFINYVFLFIFEHLFKLNHAYVVSNFFATIVSILFNFKTYGSLVFKNKDNKLILRFLAVTTFTYLVNIGGIALLEHIGSHNNYINLTVMAVPVGLLNYILNGIFVYRRKPKFLSTNMDKESRSLSFIIIAVVYVIAFAVGFLVYKALSNTSLHYLWQLFIADAVATVVVWSFGLLFRNVSVYDPYWSVAPPVMLTLWACHLNSWTSATILLLIAVWYWGIRLTGNWAFTFRNLNSEDWRYTKYRIEQPPIVFHLINFFGLNMMPTVIVFLVMIPGFFVIEAAAQANAVCWFGFLLCICAVTLQLVSDTQRHRFAKDHKGQICEVGLWRHGRHPNYFGEILMWWGVWVMYLSLSVGNGAALTAQDLCIAGAILNTCLFRFISVPLMEKRQLQNKPGYAEYQKRTRMFL